MILILLRNFNKINEIQMYYNTKKETILYYNVIMSVDYNFAILFAVDK